MTAYAAPRSSVSPAPFLFLVLLGLAALAVVASYHAVIRHGPDALTAQQCFNGQGTIQPQKFMDPLTDRTLSICAMKGKWFVSIDGPDGGNVTMFPRTYARCLRDVIDYAKRSGFTRLLGAH